MKMTVGSSVNNDPETLSPPPSQNQPSMQYKGIGGRGENWARNLYRWVPSRMVINLTVLSRIFLAVLVLDGMLDIQGNTIRRHVTSSFYPAVVLSWSHEPQEHLHKSKVPSVLSHYNPVAAATKNNNNNHNNEAANVTKENKGRNKAPPQSSKIKEKNVVSPPVKKKSRDPVVTIPEDFPVFNNNCLRDQTDGSSDPVFEWQRRAPYPVLLGTQKGGTKALHTYLAEHPLAAKNEDGRSETHFFDNNVFVRNESGIPVAENQRLYSKKFKNNIDSILDNPNRFSVDSSPRYLMYSDRVPAGLLCVAPWTKWIILLRDPVERVISHFNMMWDQKDRPVESYEQFITDDLRLMNSSGLLQDWNEVDFEAWSGSDEEAIAWTAYQQNWVKKYQVLPVGRSLYAIQIEQYLAAMDQFNKPRSDLLVLRSEDMLANTQELYDRVLDFLGLPPHTLQNNSAIHTTPNAPQTIPDEWRRYLEELYEPYNQRLYRLLGWDESMQWEKTRRTYH